MFIILLLDVKQLYCLKETTFYYANCIFDLKNFSKGEEILFIKHVRICVIVTDINVLILFYICNFCMVMKLFNTKIVKNKSLGHIYAIFNIMKL